MNDIEVFSLIQNCLQKDQTVFLLIVVENKGSSPGRAGFKMAVSENHLAGTIGGGAMEHTLIKKARQMLKEGNAQICLKQLTHNENSPTQSSGMICAGSQAVASYPLFPQDLATIDKIMVSINSKDCGFLQISSKDFAFIPIAHGTNCFFQDEDNWYYQEDLNVIDHVSIIGGGHVALALSRLLVQLDFAITIYDERSNLKTLQTNTFAHNRVILPFKEVGKKIHDGDHHYVIIMTPSHTTDENVLRQLIDNKLRYLGMMGSKSKAKEIFGHLQDDGISAEKLQRIHCPIGLPIGSRTAAEIAVSIVAELIQVKNKGPLVAIQL